MRLLFATGNPNKVAEVQKLMPEHIEVLSLKDMGIDHGLEETADTLEGNALQKAEQAHEATGLPCFADDTGLEVDALGGRPGVFSARYAGPAKDAKANMALLLEELQDSKNRKARFRTVIAYVDSKTRETVEGTCEGEIAESPSGDRGFGYDPIFLPQEAQGLTFAEMPLADKNKISHRGKALRAFVDYLGTVSG